MKPAFPLASLLALALLGVLLWRAGSGGRSGEIPRVTEAGASDRPAAIQPLAEPRFEETPAERESMRATPEAATREAADPATTAPGPAPAATRIDVRVLGKERGDPVEGERLYLRKAAETGWSASHVDGPHAGLDEAPLTDEEGRADFTAEPGVAYRIGVLGRSALETAVPALAPFEVREVELVIATEPERMVLGRLVDAETGLALGQGRVHFDPASYAEPGTDVPVRADGTFELEVRSWERQFASADAEGYARTIFALDPGHETREGALEVRLSRSAVLETAVLDRGRPASFAKVILSTDSYQLQQEPRSLNFYFAEDPSWTAATDVGGTATLADLPPRVPLRLVVTMEGREAHDEAEPIVLVPGERRRVEVLLGSGATVLGRLVDGMGAPIAGCKILRVAAQGTVPRLIQSYDTTAARTSTDEQGGFRFDDVAEGDWCVGPLSAENDPEAPAGMAEIVHVDGSSQTVRVELRADRGLYLEGTVLDPDGRPAPRCSVFAYGQESWAFLDGDTDEAGHFSLGPAPAGTYSLQAGGIAAEFSQSEPAEEEAGGPGVELRLRRGGVIRARVVDTSGAAQACEYMVVAIDDAQGWVSSATQDGALEMMGLLPGTYTLNAWTARLCGRASGIVVRAGEATAEVEVVVRAGARLKLLYGGAHSFAQVVILVDGEPYEGDGLQRDTQRTFLVPPGAIEVRWRADQAKAVRSVALAAGEERELVWDGKP